MPDSDGSSVFGGLDDLPPGTVATANAAALAEAAARHRAAVRKWVGVCVLSAFVLGISGWLITREPGKPPAVADPQPQPQQPEPKPAKSAIVPAVNFTRLHALGTVIPDGTGLVVVAYPSAYLRESESPFNRVPGGGKLAQFVARYQTETELNLNKSERAVLSLQAANPEQYVLASEGDYLTTRFATDLDRRLKPLRPAPKAPKVALPFKAYAVGFTERATAYFQPPAQFPSPWPVYFTMSSGLVDKAAVRLQAGRWANNPDVDAGMLPALNAALESPPPLLVAVVGGRMKLPLDNQPTVGELGANLVAVAVRVTDWLEVDVTVHAESPAAARRFVESLAARIAARYPATGAVVGPALAGAFVAEEPDRVMLKTRWTPEQWSVLLEAVLK
jgi:hypothetical protein